MGLYKRLDILCVIALSTCALFLFTGCPVQLLDSKGKVVTPQFKSKGVTVTLGERPKKKVCTKWKKEWWKPLSKKRCAKWVAK